MSTPRPYRTHNSGPSAATVLSIWILAFLQTTLSQKAGDPLAKTSKYCGSNSQTLGNLDGFVYTLGGWSFFGNYSTPRNGINEYLRVINTNKPFNTSGNIESYAKSFPLPDDVPRTQGSVFWPSAEENSLDLMLGLTRRSGSGLGEWGNLLVSQSFRYNVKSGEWGKQSGPISVKNWEDDVNPRLIPNLSVGSRSSVWIPRTKKGYVIGGYISDMSINNAAVSHPDGVKPQAGVLEYDQTNRKWTNISELPHDQFQNVPLVHLPTEADDLLIVVGGPLNQRLQLAAKKTEVGMYDFPVYHMGWVYIYSTAKNKWFSYDTSATHKPENYPARRSAFSTVLFSAPDNSSHQLYVHSGFSCPSEDVDPGKDCKSTTDIWVLNIPSMQWVPLLFNGKATSGTYFPEARVNAVSQKIGKSFILQSGGRKTINDQPMTYAVCDVDAKNVFVFNLQTMNWEDSFDPDLDYHVPDKVVELIGGNKTGGATIKTPGGGFSDPELAALMKSTTVKYSPSQPGPPDPPPGATPESPPKSNISIIVPVVIVNLLSIVAAAFWWWWRKRRATKVIRQNEAFDKPELENNPLPRLASEVHGWPNFPANPSLQQVDPVEMADRPRSDHE